MTSLGNEPANFHLVALCLNNYATSCSRFNIIHAYIHLYRQTYPLFIRAMIAVPVSVRVYN
jgi:hypothetical protein